MHIATLRGRSSSSLGSPHLPQMQIKSVDSIFRKYTLSLGATPRYYGPHGSKRTYSKCFVTNKALSLGTRAYGTSRVAQHSNDGAKQDRMPENSEDLGSSHAEEPKLSAEQERVVELAAAGHNIFYTGSAGCGKSTVLRAIRRRLSNEGKNVQVLAPTGRVALANSGKTTWSFAGWTPNSHKKSLDELKGSSELTRMRFRDTDTIIIDEISMVENLHLERLNQVMKAARNCHDDKSYLPFGGIQVIVTGDFCQLPPVKPFRHCINCGSDLIPQEGTYICHNKDCDSTYADEDKWAFRSKAWEECNFRYEYLETIHRQKDPEFIKLLEKCRLGLPFSPSDIDLLTRHDISNTHHAVKLYCTREEVRRANDTEFRNLQGWPHTYRCLDLFNWNESLHPYLEHMGEENSDGSLRALENHNFERRLNLKEEMLAVLLTNIDLANGLCNGSQGIIIGFERHTSDIPYKNAPEDLPIYRNNSYSSLKEAQVREFIYSYAEDCGWPIVQFQNGIRRTIYPVCLPILLGDKRPYSMIARTQIPLAPAWALSIHKSQGMTLDKVVVNLSQSFEAGQQYVALSRARGLEGLKVEGDPGKLAHSQANEQVVNFYREKFGEKVLAVDKGK